MASFHRDHALLTLLCPQFSPCIQVSAPLVLVPPFSGCRTPVLAHWFGPSSLGISHVSGLQATWPCLAPSLSSTVSSTQDRAAPRSALSPWHPWPRAELYAGYPLQHPCGLLYTPYSHSQSTSLKLKSQQKYKSLLHKEKSTQLWVVASLQANSSLSLSPGTFQGAAQVPAILSPVGISFRSSSPFSMQGQTTHSGSGPGLICLETMPLLSRTFPSSAQGFSLLKASLPSCCYGSTPLA